MKELPLNRTDRTGREPVTPMLILGLCAAVLACGPSPAPGELECGLPELPSGNLCFDSGPDEHHEGYFPAPVILARGRFYISRGLRPPVRRGDRVEFERAWCWNPVYSCGRLGSVGTTSAFFFDPRSRAVYRFEAAGRRSPLRLTRVDQAECETATYPATTPANSGRCPSDTQTVVETAPPCDDLEFVPLGPRIRYAPPQ